MRTYNLHNNIAPKLLIAAAALILAYEPFIWLIKTWFDPSYASSGFLLFLVCTSLFIWSISSDKIHPEEIDKKFPFMLLVGSAIIRLIGQMMAVNVIGALTLVVDIFAIAKLCGLEYRSRAISPFWLALSFAFSLPLERIVQRIFGYGLQNFSADGACMVLGGIFDNVSCHGIRILINAQDVLVDLPCSGARAFLLLLFFFTLSATIARFKPTQALIGIIITIISAYVINVLRICVLAAGLGYPALIGNIDVMSQPTHDVIGLSMLFLGGIPVILWARRNYQVLIHSKLPRKVRIDAWWLNKTSALTTKNIIAGCFLCIALLIISLPKKAYDVTRTDLALDLPLLLNNHMAEPVPLTVQEQNYFTQYGGAAKKASYGDQNLLMVRTSAPLRHLHAPDDCLRGLGMDVEYLGLDYTTIPTAIYKATDAGGEMYRVAVTFISSKNNFMTTNVSEAVWRWIKDPNQTWTAIQRISHWENRANTNAFDRDIIVSLGLKHLPTQFAQLTENHND